MQLFLEQKKINIIILGSLNVRKPKNYRLVHEAVMRLYEKKNIYCFARGK